MDPFIGEIRMFAGNYAPSNWAFCDGSLLAIRQATALFSLLGTAFGGNGTTTFGLPNLQGRAAMGWGNGPGLTPRNIGETGGAATVTLNSTQNGQHNHAVNCSETTATTSVPTGNIVGGTFTTFSIFVPTPDTNTVNMNAQSIGFAGGGQPHNNLQPFLAMSYIIALQGVFPTRP